MRFFPQLTLAALAGGATAQVVTGDAKLVVDALANVDTLLAGLGKTVHTITGNDVKTVKEFISAGTNLIDTIKASAATIKVADILKFADALHIVDPVKLIATAADQVADGLQEKKREIELAGACNQFYITAVTLNIVGQVLVESVLEIVPPEGTALATQLAALFTSALAKLPPIFSEDNCHSGSFVTTSRWLNTTTSSWRPVGSFTTSAAGSITRSASETTSTVYSTSTYTVTSCAPTVTNCPIGHVTTKVIAIGTTVCPVDDTMTAGSDTYYSYVRSYTAVDSYGSYNTVKSYATVKSYDTTARTTSPSPSTSTSTASAPTSTHPLVVTAGAAVMKGLGSIGAVGLAVMAFVA
ncbi:hypothetical protein B0H63DRAFT_560211 [Podospora didyma]|uniref:Cell wall protein n=1 Tax=Podospora didyma TaxID=330526 RepID=A0AAE0NQ64_9PEZI|nr:hypothetical protein B0H63DRAFT_560211 [Podospora didyma]